MQSLRKTFAASLITFRPAKHRRSSEPRATANVLCKQNFASKAQPQRGHQFDGSLNIYYADHRFYDAETGIWLSPDPIKDGLNWYTYCENNPVTNVDPTGLWAQMTAVSMQEKYKAPILATWHLSDEGFYVSYSNGDKNSLVAFSNMNRQHTSKEGMPHFSRHSPQYAIINDSHTYIDPESGLLRFAKSLNADGTPKMDLLNDYYQIAMGTGINSKAEELLSSLETDGKSSAGFTFKIVLEDEEKIQYSFDALLTDAKGPDYNINENPKDTSLYFPHNHPVEFLNGPLDPEWKYNKALDYLLDPKITDGQPSLKKIVERITNGQSNPEIVQTVEIQLYDQQGLFIGNWKEGYEYAISSKTN